MSMDEVCGFLPFVVHKSVFAELGVQMDLLVASDAIHFARVFIKNLVVARPQFIREIGPQRDETMKLDCVTDGPGQANENDHEGGNKSKACPLAAIAAML